MTDTETIVLVQGGVGHILLNRPRVLNALSAGQYHGLTALLSSWEDDPNVRLVLLEGAGERAFCAGGDIRMVWEANRRGDHDFNRDVFRTEYRLNRRIHHYPKPYVSILDGLVMGGGAGLSINGAYRVATERTRFAMPETGIGFFPDVGATHFLNRCPGQLGLYLGMTGAELGPADCFGAGLATHFVPVERLAHLKAALAAAAGADAPDRAVAEVLGRFHTDPGPGVTLQRQAQIDRCFSPRRTSDILAALRHERGEWAADTLDRLAARSPTSLKVTHRQLVEGRELAFDEVMGREYRLACRFILGHDLFEGIRAQVVDKDRRPNWSPASLAEVDGVGVDAFFAPLPGGELPLP